jgi:hypothetical protein
VITDQPGVPVLRVLPAVPVIMDQRESPAVPVIMDQQVLRVVLGQRVMQDRQDQPGRAVPPEVREQQERTGRQEARVPLVQTVKMDPPGQRVPRVMPARPGRAVPPEVQETKAPPDQQVLAGPEE